MVKRITEKAAAGLKNGETYSEKIAGRGAGALLLVGRDRSVSAYYRYTAPDKRRPWLELGVLGKDITLAEARLKSAEYATLKKTHPDLKSWLENERLGDTEALREAEAKRDLQASKGTLKDLLNDYLHNIKAKSSYRVVKNALNNEVIKPFPTLASGKANNIQPIDIRNILKRISKRNTLVYRNRVRSYLHAAFEYALKNEYDETRLSGRLYDLDVNPVKAIPMLKNAEKPGHRALTDAELYLFYNNIEKVPGVSSEMANFFRFLVLTGGQRPSQVLRLKWCDIDIEQSTMKIIDLKGKRGDAGMQHLVPLSESALDIINNTKSKKKEFELLFTASDHKHFSIHSLKNVINRFFESPYCEIQGVEIPRFTTRDIRRTCKQIMVRAGLRFDQGNLLQNHGQTGVDIRHYANNPTAFLPEKRRAMIVYSEALDKILKNKKMD